MKTLLIAFFITVVSSATFSHDKTIVFNMTNPDTGKTEYRIDDKIVTEKEFNQFLTTLKQIDRTYSCAKSKCGGIINYDATNKKGIVYHVMLYMCEDSNIKSIKRKKN